MKRLLATTAIATMAFTGAASAQSLLERVLRDIDNVADVPVTGVFANTADNLIGGALQDVVNVGGTTTTVERTVDDGDIILVRNDAGNANVLVEVRGDGTLIEPGSRTDDNPDGTPSTAATGGVVIGAQLLTDNAGNLTVAASALPGNAGVPAGLGALEVATRTTNVGGQVFETSGINASVTNILRGLDRDSATTGLASATSAVDAIVGNIDTTALGAVNTGDIELLGANTTFLEDIDQAIAGTSDALRQRVNNTVTQLGTDVNQTVLALN